jgi:hypothetical protein
MMSEKFDTEFKRKVKGIVPEVPNVVSFRIDETLASLPSKRNWRRIGFSSAAAALFLVCFIGVRSLYPSMKKEAPIASTEGITAKQDAADKKENYGDQAVANSASPQETSAQLTAMDIGNNTTVTAKAVASKSTERAAADNTNAVQNTNPVVGNQNFTATVDGRLADNQGIQLVIKSAVYDGKAIHIEFDRIAQNTSAAGNNPSVTTTSSDSTRALKAAAPEGYSINAKVDGIPLRCIINTEEILQGENMYSGSILITPDGELPPEFDILLNIDKIGDTVGNWELAFHVVKE